ncbi:hypothetical protein DX908_06615 [Parvularcula marina]|uniref:Uncharacterized protein n=2 Tax=Parvularcula marina TaxID=2292771 RepID=A0A371RHQ6_9PROT|nr:hypothetical protein DX908_06615 [Parvularcula marina]
MVGLILLGACASTTSRIDRLRETYNQAPLSVRSELSCESFSASECNCVRSQYSQLIERPDDETLLAADTFMRKSGLGDPTSGMGALTFAITMQPMTVARAKELCGISGDLKDANDAVSSLSIEGGSE